MANEVEAMPKQAARTGPVPKLDYDTLLSGKAYQLTEEELGGRDYETVRSCLYSAARTRGVRVSVQRHDGLVYVQRVADEPSK